MLINLNLNLWGTKRGSSRFVLLTRNKRWVHISLSLSLSLLKRDLSVGSLWETGERSWPQHKALLGALRVWKRVTGEPRRAKHNAHALLTCTTQEHAKTSQSSQEKAQMTANHKWLKASTAHILIKTWRASEKVFFYSSDSNSLMQYL